MEKYQLPLDIFINKDQIALRVYEQDLANNPSLARIKEKYIQDTIYTLRFLSTSMEVNEPLIFVNYMNWFGTLAHHLRFNIDGMNRHFKVCASVLKEMANPLLYNSLIQTFEAGIKSFEKSFFITEPQKIEYDVFLNHLIAMNSDSAYQYILNLIEKGMSFKDVYLNILQPTLYKVGDLWQQRVITVAKEHYITAVIQHIIGKLYSRLFNNKTRLNYSVTAVCAGEELHEIGMRMVADFFELSGWDSVFLGSYIPIDVVINQLVENPTDLFAISATTSTQLIEIRDLIKKTRSNPKLEHIKIIVGGKVFNEIPDLWKSLGADGHALDAEQAVILGTLLVGESSA